MVKLKKVNIPPYFEEYIRGKLEELDYTGAPSTLILVEDEGEYNEFDYIDEMLFKYKLEHFDTTQHPYGKSYHVRRKANG